MLNYTQGSLFYPIKYNAIMFGIAGFPHSMRQPKAAAKNMGNWAKTVHPACIGPSPG